MQDRGGAPPASAELLAAVLGVDDGDSWQLACPDRAQPGGLARAGQAADQQEGTRGELELGTRVQSGGGHQASVWRGATLHAVAQDRKAPAERFVERSRIDDSGMGRPLARRTIERERTVESYITGQELPRYIRRAREIEKATAEHERRLREAREQLRAQHAGDPRGFAAAWRELARAWSFDDVNALVRAHNAYYPIERDLPMDPRTGRYVHVGGGRSYERTELDAAWVLRLFPPGD